MDTIILSLLVDNTSGVLSRISGLFSRRAYNIDSLTVGVTSNPKISRMTIVSHGDDLVFAVAGKALQVLFAALPLPALPELADAEYGSVHGQISYTS